MKTAAKLIIALPALLVALLAPQAQANEGLVTAMSIDRVQVNALFTGEQLLVFGALSQPGNVVLRISSPPQKVALNRKTRVGPFWLNGGQITVSGAPGIFGLFSSKPLDQLMPAERLRATGLTLESALEGVKIAEPELPTGLADWRTAFLQLKRNERHYLQSEDGVTESEGKLFSARIDLPANLPLGTYELDSYLVADGKVVAHQQRTFEVHEVGFEAWVSQAAYSTPWLFGIAFTALSMFGGLGLGIALRRNSDS